MQKPALVVMAAGMGSRYGGLKQIDPVGRHDLRDVLLDLKARGKTIYFSSHELYEVESLCDRVVIVNRGGKIADENVSDLMARLQAEGSQGRPRSLEDYFMDLIRPRELAA